MTVSELYQLAKEAGVTSTLATEENRSTEYGALEINVELDSSVDAASDHSAKYGTNHA